MPLFNNPNVSIGRTRLFRLRKVEGVQAVLSQFSSGIEGVLDTTGNARNEAENVKNTIGSLAVNANNANTKIVDLDQQISGASSGLATLNTHVANLNELVNALSVRLGGIFEDAGKARSFPATLTEEQIQRLWVCERALHRVEQLVTDKDPNKPRPNNNETLEKIVKDNLTKESLAILEVTDLKQGMLDVHDTFENGGLAERYERYLAIQDLRRRIALYLATPIQTIP